MAKSEEILKEVLRQLSGKDELLKSDLLGKFPGQGPLIGYALSRAVKDGDLIKLGSTRGARYVLAKGRVEKDTVTKIYRRGVQSEEDIFLEMQDLFLRKYDIGENAKHIISFAFTEMVNNAIDHSHSDTVEVFMSVSDGVLTFKVRDRGIGVFVSVMESRGLKDERSALAELTKGKVTSAPKWHSGEGIFFTSRAADLFRLTSGFLTLERENRKHNKIKVIENAKRLKGTLVEFSIAVQTKRRLAKDVFGQFESNPEEHDFGKTEIEVGLFSRGDIHVSRSQAKRILEGLEKFKTVILDFAKIPLIGQGFADEMFRIWTREHPGTKLVVKNAASAVRFMIDRVSKES